MADGPDMEARDPNNLNEHVRVNKHTYMYNMYHIHFCSLELNV